MDNHARTPGKFNLFPSLSARSTGRLKVSGNHEIYFEECGNPNGLPVLMVHGGPGGGSNPLMRRFHDPEKYRIILFDQRGCGRSTPHAELEGNTTWDLVDDIEKLRQHLSIDRWQLFGGSWGSTLSLIYAITHPQRVSSLVLRGIFLLRQQEINWFYKDGCNALFPDRYDEFISALPLEERDDVIGSFYKRLTAPDHDVRLAAAKAWSLWEGSTVSLTPNPQRIANSISHKYAMAFARIECHYFHHAGFLDSDNWILDNIHHVRAIPCRIVHGRYDVVTPLQNAWALHSAWPETKLTIVQDAGHAMSEPGTIHELVAATQAFAAGNF